MGNVGENPYQNPSSDHCHNRQRRRTHFPEGSLVEVRTDEQGLKGAYFSATVIPPPATPTAHRKNPKKQLYVEYATLLASEEGSDRLREYVDASCVRPAPPALEEEEETDRIFNPDDVVDAFYLDGWWTGVVSRVAEGGERVVVGFQNPPEELEFGLADLRAHWDWVNGVWVKQQSAAFITSMYGVGRPVEISHEEGRRRNVWNPAIIHKYVGNGVLSVEYEVDAGKYVITKVDFDNVRPCPPVLAGDERKFVLLEKVDAYFDFAWWSGMITKALENNRYIVFLNQIKQDREFSQWDLRPHMEWKDGKWLLQSFSDEVVGDCGSLSASADYNRNTMKRRLRQYSWAALKMLEEGGNVVEDGHDQDQDQSIERALCDSVNDMGDQSSCDAEIVRKQRKVCAERRDASKRRSRRLDQEENPSLERGTIQSTSVEESLGGEVMQVSGIQNTFDWEKQRNGGVVLDNEDRLDSEFDEEPLLELIEPEEMQQSPSVIDGGKQSDGCVLDDDYNGIRAGCALVQKGSSIVSNEPHNLMPCVQKKIGLELQSLPFVKNSKLWEDVESMEVFQRIRQKPHFQPLEDDRESLREGRAIGYTIAFATLVKRAWGLKSCDPKTAIDGMIETLGELERHGFEVSVVRDILTKLLGVKAKQEMLLDEANNMNNHIQEHNCEKTRIEEEIRGMNEQISVLHEKVLLAESAKEKVDDEITALQDGLKESVESIKILECDFESIMSSIL